MRKGGNTHSIPPSFVAQRCCSALLLSVVAQRCCSALLLSVVAQRCCSALLLSVVAQRCCSALLLGVVARRCCSALLLSVVARRCCSALLLAHTHRLRITHTSHTQPHYDPATTSTHRLHRSGSSSCPVLSLLCAQHLGHLVISLLTTSILVAPSSVV